MTTRTRLSAAERRQAVLASACRAFSQGSYRGTTTAEIARAARVSEPILYRHFASKRDLYLACLDEAWRRLRELWEDAVAAEPDAREWLPAMGRAYMAAREQMHLVDLWVQALAEAGDEPEIRRFLRRQMREVHDYFGDAIRRAQDAGGIYADRDASAEAWASLALGLLGSIGRRLGGLVGDELETVFEQRRRWMIPSEPR